MNRPCFSLYVLLTSLAVCLLAVGTANGQAGLYIHTPPCLMCPYADSSFGHQDHAIVAQSSSDQLPSARWARR